MPDPRDAAARYRAALDSGDIVALRSMMTERARRSYSAEDLRQLLERDGEELRQRAQSVTGPKAQVSGEATLGLKEREAATFALEEGQFRLTSSSAVPARPQTPTEALAQLSRAARQRSLPLLLSLLVPEQRERLEERLRGLVASLERLDAAIIEVREDRATVQLPDGQVIRLRQNAGTWQIEALP